MTIAASAAGAAAAAAAAKICDLPDYFDTLSETEEETTVVVEEPVVVEDDDVDYDHDDCVTKRVRGISSSSGSQSTNPHTNEDECTETYMSGSGSGIGSIGGGDIVCTPLRKAISVQQAKPELKQEPWNMHLLRRCGNKQESEEFRSEEESRE